MTRTYAVVVHLLCWVIFGVMGRDLYIDCNNMCANSSNHVNVSCTVKGIDKMPWSHQEETAPKASFTSKNWFLHRNSIGDLVIGLNVSWEQPAVMFARHVDGYVLIMTSSTTQSGSTKWEVMTSMPQVMAAKFVKVHFNYHCFDATYYIRSGRSYSINLYPMPMYEEGNEVISDMINIDVPDCSNMEMSQSTHCLDYDDDNGLYDVYYDDEDFDSSAMGKEETSSEPNKSIQIAVPTSIFVLLCLCVAGGMFWWKRRPNPVKGSIFIFCDPSTNAAPLTSILATLLKLYAKRTVECNIWRQTVPNTLEWSRNAALAADQIIVIDGEPPFQINHGQTYLATFQPNELGKYKFPFTKRYLLMRDFKTFFKDFAADQSATCPGKQIQIISNATRQVQNADLGTKMAAQSEPLMKSVNRDSGFSSHSFVL